MPSGKGEGKAGDCLMNDEDKQEIISALNLAMISSSIPERIRRQIKDTAAHSSLTWVHSIPTTAGYGITAEYRLNPDGSLGLEFRDGEGATFWRGAFR